MKNAIFVPSVAQTDWLRDVLPGVRPAELPIAGRRFIDYALEAAVRFGVVMAEVLDWRWTEHMHRELDDTPVGTYRLSQGRWMRVVPHGFVIKNVQTWFGLNMILLKNPCGFTLPGYSAEKGVHIGSNVVLEKGVEAKPPVIVGDNAWCARNVAIDGRVIIGNGAVVAEGARLNRTIVCDDTFVGQGLDLSSKIIFGNRIIDGLTGTWTDVDDAGIARRIAQPSFGWFGKIWRFLAGTSMGPSNSSRLLGSQQSFQCRSRGDR